MNPLPVTSEKRNASARRSSSRLARDITWRSSKQSYGTAVLLADRDLVDDCLRAYAYFRWVDDRVDIALPGEADRIAFMERQKQFLAGLYRGEIPDSMEPEEAMLADLVAHDHSENKGLRSFLDHFMAVIDFDAQRRGKVIRRVALDAYTDCLALAVMDGLQYFIGRSHAHSHAPNRTAAVVGAHITHMLRDLLSDLPAGIVNIPEESLPENHAVDPAGESMRIWVKEQVATARACFQSGKEYIDSLDLLRCKLAGVWYCARFQDILDIVERDGYRLRLDYDDGREWLLWMRVVGLSIRTVGRHVIQKIVRWWRGRLHASAAWQSS